MQNMPAYNVSASFEGDETVQEGRTMKLPTDKEDDKHV